MEDINLDALAASYLDFQSQHPEKVSSEDYLRQVTASSPEVPLHKLLLKLGTYFLKLGDFGTAKSVFELGLSIGKRADIFHLGKARAQYFLKNHQESLKHLLHARRLGLENSILYNLLGHNYAYFKQFSLAQRAYLKAISLNKNPLKTAILNKSLDHCEQVLQKNLFRSKATTIGKSRKKFKRIILHIGLNKAGSTAIQYAFADHRDDFLARNNLYFPTSLGNNQSIGLIGKFDPLNRANELRVFSDKLGQQELDFYSNQFTKFEKELHDAPGDQLLISGEMLYTLSLQGILHFKHFLDTYTDEYKIVFVIRHPVSWTNSLIVEFLKYNYTLQEHYNKPMKQHIKTCLQRWEQCFSKESICLLNYDLQVDNQIDIVTAFVETCNLDAFSFDLLIKRKNLSLTEASVKQLDKYNQTQPFFSLPLNQHTLSALARERAHLLEFKGKKFIMPKKYQLQAWENAQEDMSWLKENYGWMYQFKSL